MKIAFFLCVCVALCSTGAYAAVAQPAARSTSAPAPTVSPAISNAFELYKEGKSSRVIALMNDYLKNDPNDPQALYLRGLAYLYENQNAQAAADFEATLALAPQAEQVQLMDCDTLYKLARLDDSIAACTRAIALDPKDYEAYQARALSLDAKDDASHEAQAVDDVDRAILLHPSGWNYGERCELKIELKRDTEAIPDCERSLQFDATNGWVWYQRGRLALQANDFAGALKAFDKAIENNTTVKYVYITRAQAKEGLGDYPSALDDVNHYIAEVSGVSAAYLERAKVELKLGKVPESRADAQEALTQAQAAKNAADEAAAKAFLAGIH